VAGAGECQSEHGLSDVRERIAVRRLRGSLGQLPPLDPSALPGPDPDVKTAVRWLRAHARYYGYDPGQIAAFGDSAGGQLVALLATSQGVPAPEGASLGYPRVSSSIKAAIVFYPDINLLAEQGWLSQIPFCTGKYRNPTCPVRRHRNTSARRSRPSPAGPRRPTR
jgi:hypothetical protein